MDGDCRDEGGVQTSVRSDCPKCGKPSIAGGYCSEKCQRDDYRQSAPPLGATLPYKRCSCGRVYSHAEWCELPFANTGYQLASSEILEMRNCACKSTIVVTLSPEQYLRSLAGAATNQAATAIERELAGTCLADAVLRYVRVGTLPEGQTPEDEEWLTEEIEMDDFFERERDRAEDAAFDALREDGYP